MDIEVTILGSGTGVPVLNRKSPGVSVRIGQDLILFDSGPGVLYRLLKAGYDYREIGYICYSHFHPDHFSEFVPILFASKYHQSPRQTPLTVYGAKGLKRFYNGLVRVYKEYIVPVDFKLKLIELKDRDKIKKKGWTLSVRRLRHSPYSLGYRLGAGSKIIVYSGDTDYCKGLIELAEDADILILESSFPEEYRVEGHLTPSLAGKVASMAGVKHLILNHIYPVCEGYDIRKSCRENYKGKLSISRDLMRIRL